MKRSLSIFLSFILISAASSVYSQVAVFTENETQITVTAGDWFDVSLASNKTTGYSWSLAITESNPEGVLADMGNEYIAPENSGDRPKLGASGKEVWHLKTLSAGTVNLVFTYSRPFETDKEPAKTVIFNVTVQ
jgi:inhibitor of cysteine peptidase